MCWAGLTLPVSVLYLYSLMFSCIALSYFECQEITPYSTTLFYEKRKTALHVLDYSKSQSAVVGRYYSFTKVPEQPGRA